MTPDQSAQFRHARLVLMLQVVSGFDPDGVDAERLGIYDFLAVHPLLLAATDDDPDRLALRLAGFDDRAIGYASPAQRFVSARLCLARDLGVLVGRGLVRVSAAGRVRYRLTPQGEAVASQFKSTYAQSYTTAARIVVRRVRRLSGRRLRESLRGWLRGGAERPAGQVHPAYPSRGDRDDDSTTPQAGKRPGRAALPTNSKQTALPRGTT
ncbi:MAG: hypothetical protein J2P15_09420 [Micromonosporaceae bacterium]|nr:hypothetical protein [Micromonosporaceae bacterium]